MNKLNSIWKYCHTRQVFASPIREWFFFRSSNREMLHRWQYMSSSVSLKTPQEEHCDIEISVPVLIFDFFSWAISLHPTSRNPTSHSRSRGNPEKAMACGFLLAQSLLLWKTGVWQLRIITVRWRFCMSDSMCSERYGTCPTLERGGKSKVSFLNGDLARDILSMAFMIGPVPRLCP